MTETLSIHRDWGTDNTYTKWFTLEELNSLQTQLDMDGEEFTEFITGLTDDTYADQACDIMKYMWEECSQYDDDNKLEGCYERCMRDYEFLTCFTVYRLWNTQLSLEQAREYWKDDCLTTLSGIVERSEDR